MPKKAHKVEGSPRRQTRASRDQLTDQIESATAADLQSAEPSAAERAPAEAPLPDYGVKGAIPPEFQAAVPTAQENYGTASILDVPAAERAEAAAEKIIGEDDRVYIGNTEDFPFAAICHLSMRFGNKTYVGTGWAVGPRVLVTAGHNVYDPEIGRWADRVVVTPGRDGSRAPFGEMVIPQSNLRTTKGWLKGQKASDYGAIFLDDDMEDYLGFQSFDTAEEMHGLTVSVVGYPGSKDHPDGRLSTMWGHLRRIKRSTSVQLFYDIDTTGGQSGSPVYYVDDAGKYYGVGVHNYGSTTGNFATRITHGVFDRIKSWKDDSES